MPPGAKFRAAMKAERPLQCVGTINAYHARLAERVGYGSIYLSGGGVAEGVLYGYPVTCKDGKYRIVKGLPISDFSRARMDATLKELHEERDSIRHLLG